MKDRCQAEGVHPLKHRLLGFRSEIVRPHVGMLGLETNGDIIKTKVIIITTIVISVVCCGCQILYEGLKVLENQLQLASTRKKNTRLTAAANLRNHTRLSNIQQAKSVSVRPNSLYA